MARSRKKQFCYEYPRPALTVDVVVVTRKKPRQVLLVRRKHEPFAGSWAIPGGFVDIEEALEAAGRRELLEETGVRAGRLEQLATFGDPGRDPRGRTVSVVYLGEVDADRVEPCANDDAAEVRWQPLGRLPPLAFDHAAILACAREWLRRRRTSEL
jgi:8-oxo-dGTP diphosphatase